MKNLTGRYGRGNQEYQSLGDERNPFASANDGTVGSSGESTGSSRASRSDSFLAGGTSQSGLGSGSGTFTGSASSPHSSAKAMPYAPSTIGGSDFDRYPMRKSLLTPGAAGSTARYSHSSSYEHEDGRTASLSSSLNEENDPFLVASANADFSPFGGYPASDFPLHMDEKEADDYLHNPDPIQDALEDRKCHRLDRRGWGCLVAFFLLIAGAIIVFILLPILDFTGPTKKADAPDQTSTLTPYSYGNLKAVRSSLIDPDTPEDAMYHTSRGGEKWDLVFSDEFNVDGRTFYPGDDPFWEAVNIHYAATEDWEWYDPDAATTINGTLQIRLDAYKNHNLFYRSAMLQSWNRFCFSQGYVEMGARLPGSGLILGFWPGLWTIGNLARPGYLATSEGVWPYSYDSCDAGITPNQSSYDGISNLPGQRLPNCVCPGEDHPSPGRGRGAPEIDILEGTVASQQPNKEYQTYSVASQSLQTAPMDIWFMIDYDFVEIYNLSITQMNSWTGGPLQQAASGLSYLNSDWYELGGKGDFQRFGVEYLHDAAHDGKDGYITWWVGNNPMYTMYQGALSPNGNIGERQISREPMSIVMNLGISQSWTYIDWLDLTFPAHLHVDYVRVYQPPGNHSVTCDPPNYETTQYIKDHPKAYQNPNATSWSEAGYSRPKNKLMDGC